MLDVVTCDGEEARVDLDEVCFLGKLSHLRQFKVETECQTVAGRDRLFLQAKKMKRGLGFQGVPGVFIQYLSV